MESTDCSFRELSRFSLLECSIGQMFEYVFTVYILYFVLDLTFLTYIGEMGNVICFFVILDVGIENYYTDYCIVFKY